MYDGNGLRISISVMLSSVNFAPPPAGQPIDELTRSSTNWMRSCSLPLPPLMWGARICPCRAAPAVPALAWGVYSVNTLPSPAKWSAPAAAVNQFSEVWFSCASRSVSEGLRQLAACLDFFFSLVQLCRRVQLCQRFSLVQLCRRFFYSFA